MADEYPKVVRGWAVADRATEDALMAEMVEPPAYGSVHFPHAANPQPPILTLAMCQPKAKDAING